MGFNSAKEISVEERRNIWLEGIKNSISRFEVKNYHFERWTVRMGFSAFLSIGAVKSTMDDTIKFIYGDIENENEKILAEVLVNITILSKIPKEYDRGDRKTLLINIKRQIDAIFPEYTFDWDILKDDEYIKWVDPTPTDMAPVIENVKNIDEKIADPILTLLGFGASENETMGCYNKINSRIEAIDKSDSIKNLKSGTDFPVYKQLKGIIKTLINTTNEAKGHSTNSTLTSTDIAHAVALNASLLYKLIEKIDNNKTK